MLEHGVQVVNMYISDLHGNQLHAPARRATMQSPRRDALGSGSQCYIDQAQYYNEAFGVFFQRLAQDGITPQNTLFVLSSDEGDHEAGANVGRAIAAVPPANCERHARLACTYPAGTFGELDGNVTGPAGQREERHHPVRHGDRHRTGVLPDGQPWSDRTGGPHTSSTTWPG